MKNQRTNSNVLYNYNLNLEKKEYFFRVQRLGFREKGEPSKAWQREKRLFIHLLKGRSQL